MNCLRIARGKPNAPFGTPINKLTVEFDKAGRKTVIESFLERAG